MTTAHRESGFTFRIWSNDHEPAHVHARKGGDGVVINLSPVSVKSIKGLRTWRARLRSWRQNRNKMLKIWRDTHE